MMQYRGYIGEVSYDSEARLFHGEVLNTHDVITFQGESVNEIEKAFHESVDDYLEWCREDGVSPEKPYSGHLNLRMSPELHREAAFTAKRQKLSINKFIERAVVDEIRACA
ncbi:MAG: type II toxin-antitoxin system HicB family antitoxin [Spirochaetaceae bacterium]|jgi:predicted HicB family RNase H-like nuclease|nr:type II toxin-antitoxin system HicB family antitoxin [Spirochaetaceae bacterium]